MRVVPAGLASATDRLSHRARQPESNPARTRIDSDFTPEDSDAGHRARFHHPHPRVQEKREAVALTSQGLLPKDIGRWARLSENTRRSSLRPFPAGGVERLKRLNFAKPVRALVDHRAAWEDDFRMNPPRSAAQAAADITRITGLRRGRTPVRRFRTAMGMKGRQRGRIPAQADVEEPRRFRDGRLGPRLRPAQRRRPVVCVGDAAPGVPGPSLGFLGGFVRLWRRGPAGRKRFNVRGASAAVTHERTTVGYDPVINPEAVGA